MVVNVTYWRATDATKLCKHGMNYRIIVRNFHAKEVYLHLFGHEIAIQVLYLFIGFIPNSGNISENGAGTEETFLTIVYQIHHPVIKI